MGVDDRRVDAEALTETDAAVVWSSSSGERPARGVSIGRYVVLSELGAGGMGVVYEAYDPELDRKVALKLLREAARGDGAGGAGRLLREAQALARLSHPNVVTIHDVGTTGDDVWLAMELVSGRTLRDWLAARRRRRSELLAVMHAVAVGLAAAHDAGLVHRDVKPDNVMIGDDGRVRVMDFGLARSTATPTDPNAAAEASQPAGDRSRLSDRLTRLGATPGTPAYMSPEQIAGEPIEAAADQFAFCVMLWEAIYGERPFAGDSLVELASNIVDGRRGRAPRAGAPRWLRRLLERGLAVEPSQRWPSMRTIADMLVAVPRRRRVAMVGGILAAGVIVATQAVGRQPQLCTGARAALAGVWDDERRGEVEVAMRRTELAYAPTMWAHVESRLDAWSEAWITEHTEVCEATRRRGEQSEAVMDLRMGCLAQARQHLDATVGVLAEARASSVERAHVLVGALPSLERCADVDALRADVEPPRAEDAAEVERLRAELARASAVRLAGDPRAALSIVDDVDDGLSAISYEPIRTEAWLERALAADDVGDYEGAAAAAREVQRGGAPLGQWRDVAHATSLLMYEEGFRLGHPEVALALSGIADGLSRGDPSLRAEFHEDLGTVIGATGDYPGAEAEFRKTLELRVKRLGEEDQAVATARGNIAVTLREQGKYAEAVREHRAVLALRLKILGPDHPDVADSRNHLGFALSALGEAEAAEREHREALRVTLETLGEDHPQVAVSRTMLGNAMLAQGRSDEAEAEHRAALALRLRLTGPEDIDVALARNSLGATLRMQRRYTEAAEQMRMALEIRRRLLPAGHPHIASSEHNLAAVLQSAGELEEAAEHSRVALDSWTERLGADHPNVAVAHDRLGEILVALGRSKPGERHLRAALEIRTRTLPDTHVDLAKTRLALGRLLLDEEGDRQEARTLLEAALAAYQDAPRYRGARAQAAFAVARAIEDDPQQHRRAVELAETAADYWREAGPRSQERLREAETWLSAHH